MFYKHLRILILLFIVMIIPISVHAVETGEGDQPQASAASSDDAVHQHGHVQGAAHQPATPGGAHGMQGSMAHGGMQGGMKGGCPKMMGKMGGGMQGGMMHGMHGGGMKGGGMHGGKGSGKGMHGGMTQGGCPKMMDKMHGGVAHGGMHSISRIIMSLEKMNLTQEQWSEINSMARQSLDAAADYWAEKMKVKLELTAMRGSGSLNEQRVREIFVGKAEARAQMFLTRTKLLQGLRNILSSEQLQQIDGLESTVRQ